MITKKRLEIIQRKYNREFAKYYIINNDMFKYCITDYLINLSNYIISNYINKKIENVYINYNEFEKTITLKDNILKITVYNQYLKFFYNNNTYIIKDIKIFIDFIENFFNNIENLKNFKIKKRG